MPTVVAPLAALAALALAALLCGCGTAGSPAATHGRILVVGAENQYADVAAQVGGRYVDAIAVMSSPNADPHSFEASPSVAREVADARLVVQNGLGYDGFMDKIESASAGSRRTVIAAQALLGLSDAARNPHLWYDPRTMPAVARAVADALARIAPAHAGYFHRRATRFVASLRPWHRALAALHRRYPHAVVATSEPVADDLLRSAGVSDLTPFSLQADIMNGIDPAPQAVSLQDHLLSDRRAAAFVYNRQVTDSVTDGFLATARRAGVPVVGVYETMPAGHDYQSWMLAATRALAHALGAGAATTSPPAR